MSTADGSQSITAVSLLSLEMCFLVVFGHCEMVDGIDGICLKKEEPRWVEPRVHPSIKDSNIRLASWCSCFFVK